MTEQLFFLSLADQLLPLFCELPEVFFHLQRRSKVNSTHIMMSVWKSVHYLYINLQQPHHSHWELEQFTPPHQKKPISPQTLSGLARQKDFFFWFTLTIPERKMVGPVTGSSTFQEFDKSNSRQLYLSSFSTDLEAVPWCWATAIRETVATDNAAISMIYCFLLLRLLF